MQLKPFLLPVQNLAVAESDTKAILRSHRVLAVKMEFVADKKSL